MVKNGVRIAALLAVAAGTILAVIYHAAIDPVAIRNFVLGNPLAPVMFVALQVVASLLFVPRTVLGMAAGLLFGLWWGLVWAILGAIAGASAGFAFVRWLGAEGSLDTSPGIGRLVQRAERGGWRAVAIVRLTPFPHSIANTALALTKVSWRDYLVGSSLGMLPMTAAQVSMGASGGQFLQGHGSWVVACLLLAAGLAASFLLKRAGANRTSRS